MTDTPDTPETDADEPPHDITKYPPAAQRALAEAQARKQAESKLDLPTELGGRDGPEPVRYGDWEKNGRCSDF